MELIIGHGHDPTLISLGQVLPNRPVRSSTAIKGSCRPPARGASEAPETANRLSYDLVVIGDSHPQTSVGIASVR
jgi:hypothetical protein